MITFFGFVIGLIMMVIGIMAIVKTDTFIRYFGDISEVFGLMGAQWFSWKLAGLVLLFFGFLFAFGIFGTLFNITIGKLFTIGSL